MFEIHYEYGDEPSCFLEQLCRDLQAKVAKDCAEMAMRNIRAWGEILRNNDAHVYQGGFLHMMAWAQNIVAMAEVIDEDGKGGSEVKEILTCLLKTVEDVVKQTREAINES